MFQISVTLPPIESIVGSLFKNQGIDAMLHTDRQVDSIKNVNYHIVVSFVKACQTDEGLQNLLKAPVDNVAKVVSITQSPDGSGLYIYFQLLEDTEAGDLISPEIDDIGMSFLTKDSLCVAYFPLGSPSAINLSLVYFQNHQYACEIPPEIANQVEDFLNRSEIPETTNHSTTQSASQDTAQLKDYDLHDLTSSMPYCFTNLVKRTAPMTANRLVKSGKI